MISRTTRKFRELLAKLPENIRKQAQRAFKTFMQDANHPGLHFKLVDPNRSLYSVRIGLEYRALGIRSKDSIVWIWVGSHDEYEKFLH